MEKFGSLKQSFVEKSKERFISRKGYSELGFAPSDNEVDENEGLDGYLYGTKRGFYRRIVDGFSGMYNGFKDAVASLYEMGRSDPKKIYYSLKMGCCLTLVSLLMFVKEPYIRQYSLWASLTVIVCFEYSVGASLSKGFNRALGTFAAGALALGVAEIATHAGPLREPLIIGSIFTAGTVTSFVKLHPTMKAYEYGFRVFLLTWCLVLITGNKTTNFFQTAFFRLMLIAIGAASASIVNLCILPIWAGEDLHKAVAKNFKGLATSLEGCVNGYLQCVAYDRVPSTILTYQVNDDPLYGGYRAAVQSSSKEESLVELARWEPPHGPYRSFNYPWENYVKVGGALRHCAFMVMAMHGCILSEIQAPADKRLVFAEALLKVGDAGAKVLRAIGIKVEKMEKLETGWDILEEVHLVAEELQMKIDRKSYLLVNFEDWEEDKRPKEFEDPERVAQIKDCGSSHQLVFNSMSEVVLNYDSEQMQPNLGVPPSSQASMMIGVEPSMQGMFSSESIGSRTQWPSRLSILPNWTINEKEAKTYESASSLSLATFASLLVEFVARLGNLVTAFEELSLKANFKDPPIPAEPQGGVKESVLGQVGNVISV